MDSARDSVRCIYCVSGLDRRLYSQTAHWAEGTFEQDDDFAGRLTLQVGGVGSAGEAEAAAEGLDTLAEEFRLAIAFRLQRVISLRREHRELPSFEGAGGVSISASAFASTYVHATVYPGPPPERIEQVPVEAARWILTLAETQRLADFPDEVLKRYFLLIEELHPQLPGLLNALQEGQVAELRWVRHFVSHAKCDKPQLCEFVSAALPTAVIATDPLAVRFDRTDIEHRNFVGRFDPIARQVVHALLEGAMRRLI